MFINNNSHQPLSTIHQLRKKAQMESAMASTSSCNSTLSLTNNDNDESTVVSYDDDERDFDDFSEESSPSCSYNNCTTSIANISGVAATGNKVSRKKTVEVRFSSVQFREYPRALGDNVTSAGPPITLSWKHDIQYSYNIDEYEQSLRIVDDNEDSWGEKRSSATSRRRRVQKELKIPASYRIEMLRSQGYTATEIQKATKDSTIVRNRRIRTNSTANIKYQQPVHEAIETVVRRAKRILPSSSQKNQGKRSLSPMKPQNPMAASLSRKRMSSSKQVAPIDEKRIKVYAL